MGRSRRNKNATYKKQFYRKLHEHWARERKMKLALLIGKNPNIPEVTGSIDGVDWRSYFPKPIKTNGFNWSEFARRAEHIQTINNKKKQKFYDKLRKQKLNETNKNNNNNNNENNSINNSNSNNDADDENSSIDDMNNNDININDNDNDSDNDSDSDSDDDSSSSSSDDDDDDDDEDNEIEDLRERFDEFSDNLYRLDQSKARRINDLTGESIELEDNYSNLTQYSYYIASLVYNAWMTNKEFLKEQYNFTIDSMWLSDIYLSQDPIQRLHSISRKIQECQYWYDK